MPAHLLRRPAPASRAAVAHCPHRALARRQRLALLRRRILLPQHHGAGLLCLAGHFCRQGSYEPERCPPGAA